MPGELVTSARSSLDALASALAATPVGHRLERDRDLGPLTTYRVGGAARLFVEVADATELDLVAAEVAASGAPALVIGRGSNLLVADAGFEGLAIVLGSGFADVHIDGTVVEAGAAASLPVVARQTARAGLTGFEWAVGVPGSIGGAVRMNAGGHGSDMAASLAAATVCDLAAGITTRRDVAQLGLGYRCSALAPTDVVVSARLELALGDRERAEAEIAEIVRWRRRHQPGGQNAGSVFTNPEGDSAGRLIDTAGCKGLRVGSAEVSTKHANFIQADPGGSADDVVAVMRAVVRRVWKAHGVHLVPETHLIGFPEGDERP
jgi:UDP-N-acetylmuramate dehydrogenase